MSDPAIEDVYEDVRDDVTRVAGAFARSRGLDFDEVRQEAGLAFVEAYGRYQTRGGKARGTFGRYAVFYVRKRLLTNARTQARRERLLGVRLPMAELPPTRQDGLKAVFEGLGHDARTVVDLALGADGRPRSVRAFVRRRLADMGWAAARVAESFEEVRRALS
jgi:hypothetical protein